MDVRKEYSPSGSAPVLSPEEAADLPNLRCGWKLETFHFHPHSISLALPAIPDQLLDQPEVREANSTDDYMPYWAWLWPASIKLAGMLLQSRFDPATSVLEIGCGVGIAGIAAALAGCSVTMSDYDSDAVLVAASNARRNHCDATIQKLDWRIPPQLRYSMIVGGDVLYERRNIDPVLTLCEHCLLPDGRCWFADGGRAPASEFCETARRRGWRLRILDEHCQEQTAVQTTFQVFEISRASPAAT